jgi:hypothetical protein
LTEAIKGVFFVVRTKPMELMMYVGNDLIESVPLNKNQIAIPGYLGNLKRHLKDKYASLLVETESAPEFLIIDLEAEKNEAGQPS